jgi:dihydroflavonol-4-reductase
MKIFVTGGTGFIGTHTLELLKRKNYEINLLVRKNSDRSVLRKYNNVTPVEGDLTDKMSLVKAMKGCECGLNIAGHYSLWERDNKVYREVNVDGTRNVMEAVLESGLKKVVHVSTAGVFGRSKGNTTSEDTRICSNQVSKYFKTKYEGDCIAWDLYDRKNLPLVIIYPACVLGAGDTKASCTYINDLINRKLPATVFNKRTFSFVYVKDVAAAIVAALEKEGNIGQKYLVSACNHTWREVNEMISNISGVKLPIMAMPETLTMLNAYLLTGASKLLKKPPLWSMSVDQMKVMKAGFNLDGKKAVKELNISYTPIRTALEEEIEYLRQN